MKIWNNNKEQEVSSLPNRLANSHSDTFLRLIKTPTWKVASFERYRYTFSAEAAGSTYSIYKAALHYGASHWINTDLGVRRQFANSTYSEHSDRYSFHIF